MAKPKLINGLPHDLVQSFFSTLNYWGKGYMCDWIVNAAIDLSVKKVKIDIINMEIRPKEIEITPITRTIKDLDRIIDKAVNKAGLSRDFIKQAVFDIDITNDRYIKCRTSVIAETGKIYHTDDYVEKSYEIFKAVNLTLYDRLGNWTKKKYINIRFKIFGNTFNSKLRYTKRLENEM